MNFLIKHIRIIAVRIYPSKNEKPVSFEHQSANNEAVDNSTYNILLFDNKFIYSCIGNELRS